MTALTGQERARLRAEIDKAGIRDALRRYCRGVDRGDEQLLASADHQEAHDAHGPFRGNAHQFAHWAAEEISRNRLGLQHIIGHVLIELDGEIAQVETYYVSCSRMRADPGVVTLMGGRYLDRFERRPGTGWRIARRTVIKDWAISDRLEAEVAASLRGYPQGRFDHDDLLLQESTWMPAVADAAPTEERLAMTDRTEELTERERAALRAALDRAEITETINRYCRGIDRGDEELTRSTYQPDAIDSHGPFHGLGTTSRRCARRRFRLSGSGVQHLVGNITIELDGDVARVESYFVASFRLRAEQDVIGQMGGRYLDRFERRASGPWLVARRTVVKDWTLSDRVAADLAPSVRGYPEGRFDREDLVYLPATYSPVAKAEQRA